MRMVMVFAHLVISSVAIPEGVCTIGKAFIDSHNLVSVTIPASVSSIGERTFSGCDSLTEIRRAKGSPINRSRLPEGARVIGVE